MMSHVDERNFRITLFDLILHEYLLSCEERKNTFIDIVSPYLSNYPIPTKWPSFLSNVISVSDIDTFYDLLKLIVQNEVKVRLITLSPGFMLSGTSLSSYSVKRQIMFVKNLFELGCKIYLNNKVHAKIVITSQGVLEGSANITTTGMETDLQYNSGNYFPKKNEVFFNEKVEYLKKLFDDSKKADSNDFKIKS